MIIVLAYALFLNNYFLSCIHYRKFQALFFIKNKKPIYDILKGSISNCSYHQIISYGNNIPTTSNNGNPNRISIGSTKKFQINRGSLWQ